MPFTKDILFKNPPYSTSDHMPVVANFSFSNKQKKLKIASWNIMKQCSTAGYGNNPYHLDETAEEYLNRFKTQAQYLAALMNEGVDFILLQEADFFHNPNDKKPLEEWFASNGYEIIYDTPLENPPHQNPIRFPRGLITIHKKSHKPKRTEMGLASRNNRGFDIANQMVSQFAIDGDENFPLAIGNFHLGYNQAAAQAGQQKQEAQEYQAKGIAFIAAGDANAPTTETRMFSTGFATCHDSIKKEQGPASKISNSDIQGIHHKGDRASQILKDYDSFEILAANDDISVTFDATHCRALSVNEQNPTEIIYHQLSQEQYKTAHIKAELTTEQQPSRSTQAQAADRLQQELPKRKTEEEISQETKDLIDKTIKKILDKNTPQAPTAEEKKIIEAFNKSIENQKQVIFPNQPYRGSGIKSKINKLGNEIAIKIIDIYSPDFARFTEIGAQNPLSEQETKDLKGCHITAIKIQGEFKTISKIAKDTGGYYTPRFMHTLTEIFRQEENELEFKIDISGEEKILKCQQNIFVNSSCREAGIDPKKSGEKYDVEKHSAKAIPTYKTLFEEVQTQIKQKNEEEIAQAQANAQQQPTTGNARV